MGKASISINIGALWEGESAIKQTNKSLNTLTQAAKLSGDSIASSAAKFGESIVNMGNRVQSIGNSITAFGDTLTHSITEPATAIGGYCVQQATKYDTALADLNKTADLTAEQLEDFGQAAIDASKTQPVDAATILTLEALGAQLGYSTEGLEDLARISANLDIATNLDAETAATQLAQFANITGMAESETENYGSTIVDLGNHLATTESAISNMSLRLAGISTIANFTSSDILGMAGAMSSLGINAEAGGTAMTTVISNISKGVNEGGEDLENYARISDMTAEQFAAKWKDRPIEAIEALIEGTGRLQEQGVSIEDTMSSLGITTIRQSDLWRRLAGQSDTLTEAVSRANDAWDENTALTVEVDKRNQSVEARFQTLQNKVNATAIEVGTVLAEALLNAADRFSPVIDAASDLARAISELPTPTKNAMTTLGLLAVAAGPVISAFGKVVTAIGSVTTKVGEGVETFSVLKASLSETDGSLLRTYASSNKVSAAIGLAGNKALEAAGGVDNYVKSWEGMESAAKKMGDATKKVDELKTKMQSLTNAGKGSSDAFNKLKAQSDETKASMSVLSAEFAENANQITEWTNSDREMTAALERSGVSMSEVTTNLEGTGKALTTVGTTATTAGSLLKGFGTVAKTMLADLALSAGVALAVAAVTAAVSALATAFMEAKEKEELLSDVTQTAGGIMDNARASAANYGDAIGTLAIDSDSTLQKVKELNSSIADSMNEFTISSAKVDQYVAVMQELGNKSNLTATEQWKLQKAVEGYNSVTGESYQLTEDYKVALQGENGLVTVSTDELNNNAQAWRAKAEAEAYAAKATEYLEAEIEAQMKLKQAQEQLAAAQERRQELVAKGTKMTEEERKELDTLAQTTIPELKTQVSDLSTAYQSAAQSTEYLSSMAEIAASSLSDNLKTALQELPSIASSAAIDMANNFQAGIAAEAMTMEDAEIFVSGVKETLAGLPTETQAYGAQAASALSSAIANGKISATEAASLIKDAVSGNIADLPTKFQEAGVECPTELAGAISAYASLSTDATQAMKDAIILNMTNGDVVAAAELLGHDIDEGLAQAIQDNNTTALDAMGITSDEVIQKAKSAYGINSPSRVFMEIGTFLNQGLAEGINNETSPITAAGDLATKVVDKVKNLPDTLSKIGTNASSWFSTGIGSFASGVADNAKKLFTNADSNTKSTEKTLKASARSASSSFASGLSSAAHTAGANAAAMAAKAATMANGNYYQSGSHLSSNFASGIRAGIGWVASAARSIAQAAKNALGFSVPKEGPWSGAEKGGATSGLHLAQNFAQGMLNGVSYVSGAANTLASAAALNASYAGAGNVLASATPYSQTSGSHLVTNNYTLNINGTTLQNSSAKVQAAFQVLVDELITTTNMG